MVKWEKEATQELITLYVEIDTTSDSLIKDKNLMSKFTGTLNERLPGQVDFTDKQVADRLLWLRKSGKLPRLRR